MMEDWHLAAAAVALALTGLAGWLVVGRGPRQARALRRGQRRLRRGQWREGLAQVDKARLLGPLSAGRQAQADQLAGECHRLASGAALTDKNYELSLDHLLQASRLLQLQEADAREYVVGAMLAEVRRLYAESRGGDAQTLLDRVLRLDPARAEALFWQAQCWLRAGQAERARPLLQQAHERGGGFDPPFYLGMLLLRAGQPTEALRYLSAAHRVEPGCPFVNWQLGQAMIAAGSDPAMALRALQRALAPTGLPRWEKAAERAWAEGLPDIEKSFLRRLAEQHAYACPLLGNDIKAMLRQGRLALAQAHLRLGQFEEAAALGRQVLGESAPTLPVLRTLGLALARLEQYDEAFKHLRAAYDIEEPKTSTTAGYLALCGALGKPVRPEDKFNNVVWAIGLLRQFPITGDPEWAGICARVLAEARPVGLVPALDDVRRAAEAIASVDGADPLAAVVYDQLAEHGLAQVAPTQAWLYCRAVAEHGVRGQHDLGLFALAFRQTEEGRAFFEQRGWDFDEAECLFLIRWAEGHPGTLPAELMNDRDGVSAQGRARQLLLARSRRLEEAGWLDDALDTAAALARLLPESPAALDRLACLHSRKGDGEQAVTVLTDWQSRHPGDHRPHLRRAVLEQQRGNALAGTLALQQALALAQGQERARAAWLATRLKLATTEESANYQNEVISFLCACLEDQPDHADALACLAALRWQAGARQDLAVLSQSMEQTSDGAGYHYLAAVCHLQAGRFPAALASARQAATEPALIQEARLLMAWAHLGSGEPDAAIPHLKMVATDPECRSVELARAALGRVRFQAGDYDDAVHWWQQIPAPVRAGWRLEPALQAGVFLAGLTAFRQGRFEESAQRFREAGRLGCRDRRLGLLLQLALFKAGQQLLFPSSDNHQLDHQDEKAATLLDKCLQVGSKDPQAASLLALAYQRQGRVGQAREALGKIAVPDAGVFMQRGLLALQERQLAAAEEEFARARQLDPASYAAGYNLFLTRLSLGKLAEAGDILPALLEQASEGDRDLFRCLQPLLGQEELPGHPLLAVLNAETEARLLALLRQLGNLEAAGRLLERLQEVRPDRASIREAQFEVALLTARQHLLSCEWGEVEPVLSHWARRREVLQTPRAVLHNLLGCAACLGQDFATGNQQFTLALRLDDHDARLYQNHALALEWSGNFPQAEREWLRALEQRAFLRQPDPDPRDLFAATPAALRQDQETRFRIDLLLRLAGIHSDKLQYAGGLRLVEMAHQLWPEDPVVLDRLFTLYRQLDRMDLARRTLQRLQQLAPGDPHFDLYELELTPMRRSDELDRWISGLEAVLQRHPHDRRVQERAAVMLGTFITTVRDLTRQATDQFARAVRQVRALRHDEINWRAVHRVMRDLQHEFGVLRHAIGRALVIDAHPDHHRQARDLVDQLDRKVEETRRWQGPG